MYDILDIHTEAKQAAKNAVGKFLADWNEKTGGNEYGEPMYCGFANVSIHPARGRFVSTMKKLGIGSTGYGGGYRISYYDIMGDHKYSHTQSMSIKEEACEAFRDELRKYGLTVYAESRAD